MQKFESIRQFRDIIVSVARYSQLTGKPIPTLTFIGSVKLNGTNSSIIYDGGIAFQSRNMILSDSQDNYGFYKWGIKNQDILAETIKKVQELYPSCERYAFFGEWFGPGVHPKGGVRLPYPIFAIFTIRCFNGDQEIDLTPSEINQCVVETKDIRSIYKFKTWTIEIDFSNPKKVQNELVSITQEVEANCPVLQEFGIAGVGEGVVWINPETRLRFKVKGEKHSASKVKTLNEVAAIDIEKAENATEFAEITTTENRLEQGILALQEQGFDQYDIRNTGKYVQWVITDILKEESDRLETSELTKEDVIPKILVIAKAFWFAHLKKGM